MVVFFNINIRSFSTKTFEDSPDGVPFQQQTFEDSPYGVHFFSSETFKVNHQMGVLFNKSHLKIHQMGSFSTTNIWRFTRWGSLTFEDSQDGVFLFSSEIFSYSPDGGPFQQIICSYSPDGGPFRHKIFEDSPNGVLFNKFICSYSPMGVTFNNKHFNKHWKVY